MTTIALTAAALLVNGTFPHEQKSSFTFNGQSYLHRFSEGDLHEFTPKAQSNLKTWTDMFTVNVYAKATDGEGLASMANTVLENYKSSKAVVVKTDSVARTDTRPAEHLIVVLFPRAEFVEAAFARFRMQDGHGASLVYSHRVYGKRAGDTMSSWLKANGPKVEKELMSLKSGPKW